MRPVCSSRVCFSGLANLRYAQEDGTLQFQKLQFVRFPLRLGLDVFTRGKISKEREEQFLRMIKAFRQLMIMIKYGTLSNEAAGLTGCVSYNLEYHPALAENNVERVLVTTAQGANILVGSTMQLSTSSRGGTVTFVNAVLSKETVTIDGTEYCAVNIGNGGTTFNTTTDLFFNSMPWSSGTTDNVLGNDGAAVASSDKYPVKIQGIECMVGAYEVAGDVICTLANNAITYRVCKIAAKIATSATSDYGTVGFTTPQPATAGRH